MPSLRIIVVDDDDAIRSAIAAVVQETLPSAEVVEHSSSLHVLQDISTGGVDLLITNCNMPDMDGPTLIKTLRREKNAVPIIMVSGSGDARELAEEIGVDRFVAKEAIHVELRDAIRSLLAM